MFTTAAGARLVSDLMPFELAPTHRYPLFSINMWLNLQLLRGDYYSESLESACTHVYTASCSGHSIISALHTACNECVLR